MKCTVATCRAYHPTLSKLNCHVLLFLCYKLENEIIRYIFFKCKIQFLVIKKLDLDPDADRDSAKTLDSSVVDPDQVWIRIQWGPWIRIQESKNDHKKRKVNKFHFLKC